MLSGFVVAISLYASSSRAEETQPVVHVDSSSAIVVERVDDEGHAAPVCRAPCDQPLAAGVSYQLAGEGIRTSNQFRLPATRAVTIDVKPRATSTFATGIVLVTISGVLLTGGFFLLGATVALMNAGGFASFGTIFTGGGAIVCGTGALATGIPGVAMLASNIQSRARIVEGDRQASMPSPSTVPLLTRAF